MHERNVSFFLHECECVCEWIDVSIWEIAVEERDLTSKSLLIVYGIQVGTLI